MPLEQELLEEPVETPSLDLYPYFIKDNDLYVIKKGKKGEETEFRVGRLVRIKNMKQDIETKSVWLTLEYWFNNQMNELVISRKQLQLNEFTNLLEKGLDIYHHKAGEVLKFLSIQEEFVPTTYVHHQAGWAVHEEKLIYKHHHIIGNDDLPSEYEGVFQLKAKGTLENWLTLVKQHVVGHTPLEVALTYGFAAALVSLIAKDLDLEVLVSHAYGDSSQGKTTAARVFVSPYGAPTSKEGGLICKWNGTQNGIVAQLANHHGLPVALDEASMNRMKDFTETIYLLAEGSEKARMTKELALRERRTWSGVIFSTAEHSLQKKANQNTGLKVRLFEFGNIFWTTSAEHANQLKVGLLENYGHAGPLFSQFLINTGKETVMDTWRKWATICLESMTIRDAFSHRIADKLALVMATAELVNQTFDFTLNLDEMLDMLVGMEQQSAGQRDIGENAYNYFKQMIIQHRSKFDGESFPAKAYECWGKITQKGSETEVAMLTTPFKQMMADGGFEDSDVILQSWKEKGYLDHDADKLTRKRAIVQVVGTENDGIVQAETKATSKRELTYCIRIKENIFDMREEGSLPNQLVKARKMASGQNASPVSLYFKPENE